jgi:electron transfer flavoprotein beta subunit
VLSLGGAGIQPTLRNALAMGADRAIHLEADGAPDALAVANALAAEIRPLSPAIVWCGRQAIDDDAAAVGPMLGELLGLPCVTSVSKFERSGDSVVVERDIEGGREVVETTLPAVITTDKGLNEPRYASLKGIMAAKKKPIDAKPARSVGHISRSPRSRCPPRARPAASSARASRAWPELIRVLREEAKLL